MNALKAHLETGTTTICRAWAVTRRDGVVLGFTDHDRDLAFEGMSFRAASGLTARALQQGTGLAVDNTEALGALTDAGLTEADILAGRYDGAEVRLWQVNWADVEQREMLFRGSIGEITRAGGAFRAELRGLTEMLNHPRGRVFQRDCSAVLGDGQCRVDTGLPAFSVPATIMGVEQDRVFRLSGVEAFGPRWFEHGRLTMLSGAAAGLVGMVKNDRQDSEVRMVELWQSLGPPVGAGDQCRLEAGCDKRIATCREKFGNLLNFRGFPHIPGEDWMAAFPANGKRNDGGSLNR